MCIRISCPSCGAVVPAETIPDDVLKSERGRRNAAKRKTFGARRKGQIAVWRSHRPSAWRCRCPKCLLAYVRDLEQKVDARIKTHLATVGVAPEWAAEERSRMQKRRSEVEWAILERHLDDLEATHERAA